MDFRLNYSAFSSERVTAIISTLVAIAILASVVTAFQPHQESVDNLVQLESDLRFQLESAFRHDPNQRALRLEQLQQVTEDWMQSPQSSADRGKLTTWLLESTLRSMPGSSDALPALPSFGAPTVLHAGKRTPDIFTEPPANIGTRFPENPTKPMLADPRPSEELDFFSYAEIDNNDLASDPLAASQLAILPAPGPPPAHIDLIALDARIAGYHQGLDDIEVQLHSLATEDLASLAEQVRQLEEISGDSDFVTLYYQALTNRERRSITAPRPLTATITQIERQLDRTESARSGDFLNEFDANNLERISELRERLADLAR